MGVSGETFRRIGVWAGRRMGEAPSLALLRPSTDTPTRFSRRHADTPIRPYAETFLPPRQYADTFPLRLADRLQVGSFWGWRWRFDRPIAAVVSARVRIEEKVEG
jgi:hypothetical protein